MMTLTLSAAVGRWQAFNQRKQYPNYAKLSKQVFYRDQYTCQFCSFQAHEFQEIINLDHDYCNNAIDNMKTACVFCSQCFFMESVGNGDFGGGNLIYLPEMTQPELNSLCHVLFCAMVNETDYRSSAQAIYRSLKFRSQVLESQFGEGLSEPALFGQLLIDYQENAGKSEAVAFWFDHIRLLPSRARFKTQIETWAATALGELSQSDEATADTAESA